MPMASNLIISHQYPGDCHQWQSIEKQCMFFKNPVNERVVSALDKTFTEQFSFEGENQAILRRSISDLQSKFHDALSTKFHGVRLTVYGSCLSGLALEGSHDVDVLIHIPELVQLKRHVDDGVVSKTYYRKRAKTIVFRVMDSLKVYPSYCFRNLTAITWARVPVIKGCDIRAYNPYSSDGSLPFDLTFLNDLAVVNSWLLREYSSFDSRVRLLMLCVKSFAKKNGISSAAEGTLSSYTWLNLVVFYLQCIGFVPNLQSRELMKQLNCHADHDRNPWHCIRGLETFYLRMELVTASGIWKLPDRFQNIKCPNLLYGFFNFYKVIFPQQTAVVSIRLGNFSLMKSSVRKSKKWRLCIEDPFETFDCDHAHDLGSHLNERGQAKVMACMSRARQELGCLLQKVALEPGIDESFISIIGGLSDKRDFQRNSSIRQSQPAGADCNLIQRPDPFKIESLRVSAPSFIPSHQYCQLNVISSAPAEFARTPLIENPTPNTSSKLRRHFYDEGKNEWESINQKGMEVVATDAVSQWQPHKPSSSPIGNRHYIPQYDMQSKLWNQRPIAQHVDIRPSTKYMYDETSKQWKIRNVSEEATQAPAILNCKKRFYNMNYCYSCGFDVDHDGPFCPYPNNHHQRWTTRSIARRQINNPNFFGSRLSAHCNQFPDGSPTGE